MGKRTGQPMGRPTVAPVRKQLCLDGASDARLAALAEGWRCTQSEVVRRLLALAAPDVPASHAATG